MTRTHLARRSAAKFSAAFGVSGLVAVGSIVALASSATAAEFTAGDEASYYQAIEDAMANVGPDTIVLSANITLLTDDLPVYDSDDDLTVDGKGFSIINGDVNRDLGGFHAHEEGPLDGSFEFIDITFSGFSGNWPAIWVDAYGTVDLTDVTVEDSTGDGGVALLVGGNVTVTNSVFTGNEAPDGDGGGLLVEMSHGSGTVTVTGSTFTDNWSDDEGGAIAVDNDAALTILDSTFTGNSADDNGGAVYSTGDIDVDGSTFTDNETRDNDLDGGGAIYADSYAEISWSTFTDNYSDADGGALFAWFSTNVYDSTFTGNEAAADGGAVYVGEEDFTSYSNTFDGNAADGDGGAVWGYYYADSFDSTWVGNTAGDDGGAIYSDGSDDYSYSWNSTYVNNSAVGEGGAFYGDYYYYETYHSTYTGNSAAQGSHVYVYDDVLYAYASVFAENAGADDACYADEGTDSWGYNFDQDGSCTDGWEADGDLEPADGSPLLGALAHNGGPTKTRLPGAGSVLIDAVDVDVCEDAIDSDSYLEGDQRGVERPQGDACDIGAVEVIPAVVYEFEDDSENVIATATVSNAVDWDCGDTYTLAELGGTPPAGVSFPWGGFDFCIMLPGEGWPTTVTWTFASPVTEMWKIDEGVWSKITSAVVSGNTVTYTITDGDDLDLDDAVDGYIYDPAAAGISAAFTG